MFTNNDSNTCIICRLNDNKGLIKKKLKQIKNKKRCVSGFLAIDNTHAPVSPISAARVYASVSHSRMVYVVEVSEVSNPAKMSLEGIHWDIGKRIQGWHCCTPNLPVTQSMDWLSIASIIYERRLGFLGRISSLERTCSSKYTKVAIIKVCMSKQK